MAVPAASGLTALMLAYQQKQDNATLIRNNRQLRAHWRSHSVDAGAPGQDTSFGWGIPDATGNREGRDNARTAPHPPTMTTSLETASTSAPFTSFRTLSVASRDFSCTSALTSRLLNPTYGENP